MALKSVRRASMKQKFLLGILALIIILIIAVAAAYFLSRQNSLQNIDEKYRYQNDTQTKNEKYCASDRDCACGVHIRTGECFYGNRNFVDTSRQCPDFCNGIAANLAIRCVDNKCVQVNIRQ